MTCNAGERVYVVRYSVVLYGEGWLYTRPPPCEIRHTHATLTVCNVYLAGLGVCVCTPFPLRHATYMQCVSYRGGRLSMAWRPGEEPTVNTLRALSAKAWENMGGTPLRQGAAEALRALRGRFVVAALDPLLPPWALTSVSRSHELAMGAGQGRQPALWDVCLPPPVGRLDEHSCYGEPAFPVDTPLKLSIYP